MFYCGATSHDYYQTTTERLNGLSIRHTIRIVTPPTVEPVTINEAKAQLHIAANDDSHDAELAAMIAASREEWERDTSAALITRTIEHRLPRFVDVVRLTVRPVIAIESIKYIDNNGDEQTVSSDDYYLDIDEVRFKAGYNKPSIEDRSEAVRITYTAGYGADSRHAPELDRMAIKMNVANRFEDRDMMGNDIIRYRRAYEALVAKKMRASYP